MHDCLRLFGRFKRLVPHLPGEEGGEEEGQHDGGDGVCQHETEHWVAGG